MAKEKDFETIEGGDSANDEDMGQEFEGGEEKEIEKVVEEKDASAKESKEVEELRFKDGDEEWDKDKGEVEEKEEKKEEEVEVEKEKEGEKELSEEEKKDKQTQEDVIKYLDETPENEGGGTKYRIKGKDYDLRDLSPQEFKQRFSLAGRAYERMEEVAHKEKDLVRREGLAEQGAIKSQEIMRRYGEESPGKGEGETSLPDILKPDDEDTDLERSLKEMNADLHNRVGSLESGQKRQDFETKEQTLYRQLESLQEDFPMMSKSEVIAVKSMPQYADVDIRTVAENSHNERMGDTYLDSVFKVRPDKLREIEEKAIERHLTGKPNVRKISRKSSSTVASTKVSSGKRRPPSNFDEIEAREDEMRRGYEASLEDVD